MPRNNKGRRQGSRKSGEFKTCEEGASFVRSETVRQAKKHEEEGGRAENQAEVHQLRSEIRELKTRARTQEEINEMLKAALISCMSCSMHDAFEGSLQAVMEEHGYGSRADVPAWRKEMCMTEAKQEAFVAVADDMIYLTHPGRQKHYAPSKVAVEAFGEVVGYNGYQYKSMATEQKELLYENNGNSMFHRRLFCECRELDWKQAIKDGRDFHDYRKCVQNNTRHYVTEKAILLGEPLPYGHEDYVIPEFP